MVRRVERTGDSADVICDTAAEFLKVLAPVTGMFTSSCIYRGVPSLRDDLVPAAHRKGRRLFLTEYETTEAPRPTVREQCSAEFFTIDKFFSIASRHGVRIPEDSFILRTELDDWRDRFLPSEPKPLNDLAWPSPQLFSLIALAQHYGVPTRALDWTWSPFTAAYFAARPALGQPTDDSIAVWVFDDFTRKMDRLLNVNADRPLVIFSVSGADNDNLRAQRGLFMLHPHRFADPDQPFLPKTYDQLLLESLPVLREAASIMRVTLARAEA